MKVHRLRWHIPWLHNTGSEVRSFNLIEHNGYLDYYEKLCAKLLLVIFDLQNIPLCEPFISSTGLESEAAITRCNYFRNSFN